MVNNQIILFHEYTTKYDGVEIVEEKGEVGVGSWLKSGGRLKIAPFPTQTDHNTTTPRPCGIHEISVMSGISCGPWSGQEDKTGSEKSSESTCPSPAERFGDHQPRRHFSIFPNILYNLSSPWNCPCRLPPNPGI